MQKLLQDLRYAVRQLWKSPGFAFTALLTLGLGIGATTAIFTLVYDVLLRPLPYRNPGELVFMDEKVAEWRDSFPRVPMSANHFVYFQQHSQSFQSIAIADPASFPLGMGGHPVQVEVLRSTPGIFSVFDTFPQLGRGFTGDEIQSGRGHVIVLLDGLWRRQFQADPHIVGKSIALNGFPYTVIGVMPASFHLPSLQASFGTVAGKRPHSPEALVPLVLSKEQLAEAMGEFNYVGLGRLKPGVSAAQANAEIDTLEQRIGSTLPADERATLSATITPLQQILVGDNHKPLVILLSAVAGLLLVGCINITNLLLARAVSRRREMSIASALGATRGDLVRAAMREIALIAAAGGTIGVLVASALIPLLQHYLPPVLDFRGPLHLDWAGAGCALLLTGASMLAAGLVPAWIGTRTSPHEVLHSEAHLASESRSNRRLRQTLVAVEVATSVSLVLLTGLLVVSLSHLMHVDRGFQSEQVLSATVHLPAQGYPKDSDRVSFYRRALEQVAHLPGAEATGVVSVLPLDGDNWGDIAQLPGDSRPVTQMPSEHFRWISPGYPEAIHLSLAAGRTLRPEDGGKNDALVSELTARTLWPGKDPIGQRFNRGDPRNPERFTVIGVLKDAHTLSLSKPDPLMIYVPYWYRTEATGSLVVRTRLAPAAMAEAMQKAIWSVDPGVSVPTVRALGGVVTDSLANLRFEMDLLLVFALTALLLAGLGVYGVVTYSVLQREREIGLRIAVGAQALDVYRLVLRDGMAPVLLGAAAGLGVAFACGRLIGSLLFQVSPYSPGVAAGAVGVLLAIGIAGCLLPARRAAAVDPMEALRGD